MLVLFILDLLKFCYFESYENIENVYKIKSKKELNSSKEVPSFMYCFCLILWVGKTRWLSDKLSNIYEKRFVRLGYEEIMMKKSCFGNVWQIFASNPDFDCVAACQVWPWRTQSARQLATSGPNREGLTVCWVQPQHHNNIPHFRELVGMTPLTQILSGWLFVRIGQDKLLQLV